MYLMVILYVMLLMIIVQIITLHLLQQVLCQITVWLKKLGIVLNVDL